MIMAYLSTSFLEINYKGNALPMFAPLESAIIYSYVYDGPSNTTTIKLFATNNGDSTKPVALFTVISLILSYTTYHQIRIRMDGNVCDLPI